MLWIIIGAIYLTSIAWFAWEISRAPLIEDEDIPKNEEG